MGAEDFAMIAARVPSFVLRVGSGAAGRDDHLHNSAYQPDEACIGLGRASAGSGGDGATRRLGTTHTTHAIV